ncbi:cytochrome P450 [Streptomyces sp. NPDC003863]
MAVRDERDGRLSEEELVGTSMMLIVAGHESAVNLLGNATLALLLHPGQLAALRERPELMPGAVEEFLRHDTSVERTTNRYAAEDLELGGVHIPRGGLVVVALGSAGHDAPQAKGTDPAVLDVARPNARHLAFGHGIHYCLGAPLARLETTIAPSGDDDRPARPPGPRSRTGTRRTGRLPGKDRLRHHPRRTLPARALPRRIHAARGVKTVDGASRVS